MNPDDRAVADRDRALPGLRTLLDPVAFESRLREAWPRLPDGPVIPRYIRYKPGTNCLAAFELGSGDKALPIYAKAHRPDDAIKFDHASKRSRADGRYGLGRACRFREGLVISLFPNDSKLRHLDVLASESQRNRFLAKLFPDHGDVSRYCLSRLRYKPERRLVVRVHRPETLDAVVKFYTRGAYPDSRRRAHAFGASVQFEPVPVIAQSDRHRALAFPWMPGRVFSDIIACKDSLHAARQIGAALASLHAQPGNGLICCDRAMDLARYRSVFESISLLVPALSETAGLVLRNLASRLVDLSFRPAPIHGDFYAEQVLVEGARTFVLDFDRSRLSDPATDLGSFMAHLERDQLRGTISRAHAAEVSDAFVDGYHSTSDSDMTPRIAVRSAAALFEMVLHPFRLREPDWLGSTERILAGCLSMLANKRTLCTGAPPPTRIHSRRKHALSIDDPSTALADPTMPFLSDVSDPETIMAHFGPLIGVGGSKGEIRPTALSVRRHKPGRRCLIEVRFNRTTPGKPDRSISVLGKVRAKGLDMASFRAYQALYRGEFGPASGDGIMIPEPLGHIRPFRMWVQRTIPGSTATTFSPHPTGPIVARRIARALAKLHACPVRPERTHTLEDELNILRTRLPKAGEIRTAWASRIDAILSACDRLAASIDIRPPCPIHRDFYPDNVLVNGGDLYLIDFDLFCMGDPALDAGNFAGHLIEQSLRSREDFSFIPSTMKAFEEAVVAEDGEGFWHSVDAYTTLTLVRHIYLSTCFPDRTHTTGPLLSLCEQRLSPFSRSLISRPAERCMEEI